MSIERPDCGDMSDVSISESSYADARADTPTMGENRSDSEDTLSNLSFDNDDNLLDNPVAIGTADVGVVTKNGGGTTIASQKRPGVLEVGNNSCFVVDEENQRQRDNNGQSSVNVRVQINDYEMDEDSLNLPPGAAYKPPTVEFPSSPSQLKVSQGPSYMPTEDAGVISEDDSSVNSYHAHLGLNGNVRLTKREGDEEFLQQQHQQSYLRLPSAYESLSCGTDDVEPESLQLEDADGFDDYIEDFFNPLSNEPVMQRATSFRRKVQKQLEEAVVEKSIKVINNFDAMLSTYENDEEGEDDMDTLIDNINNSTGGFTRKRGENHAILMKRALAAAATATPDCKKCHGFTPLCSDCRAATAKVLNRVNFDSREPTTNGIRKSVVNGHHGGGVSNGENNLERSTSTSGDSISSNGVSSSGLSNEKTSSSMDSLKERKKLSQVMRVLNFLEDQEDCQSEPQSLLDIDAICNAHAPNLMNSMEPQSFSQFQVNLDDETSNYFLPKETLNKIQSVFESSNFTNFYTLSGELKHILTPAEIEEIVANKEQLAAFLNPDVMAALSMSLNESSLPVISLNNHSSSNNNNNNNSVSNNKGGDNNNELLKSLDLQNNILNTSKDTRTLLESEDLPILIAKEEDSDTMNNCFSSATSISNGYNSKESSLTDVSDQNELMMDEPHKHNKLGKKTLPPKDTYGSDGEKDLDTEDLEETRSRISQMQKQSLQNETPVSSNNSGDDHGAFQRGTNVTNSFRRKIALGEDVTSGDLPQKYVEDENCGFGMSPTPSSKTSRQDSTWKSLESLDDLDVDDGIDDNDQTPKMFLVRRDSKRFNKEDATRVIQGLFVESKNKNGTLKRLKVPLNIADDNDLDDNKSVEESPHSNNDHNKDSLAVKSPRTHKKRISVDDHILSIASEMDDSDVTQSDVFHSIINSVRDEDRTIRSDGSGDEDDITLDLDTPDDMEESILEQLESIATTPVDRERIPELTAAEELEDERCWKSFRVGANDIQIDLKAIQPYRRVLSHGGYADAERKVAIILFSGCFLPDRSRKEYAYLLDHLFLYVLSSLEELIVEDYILVYLHGATPKSCMPTFSWLKRCYQLIDRRLRKNLKGLYLVHPTFWLKTVVALTKPFVSSKFSRKVQFVNTLADLCLEIPTEHLVIPDRVLHYDFELKVDQLRKQNKLS